MAIQTHRFHAEFPVDFSPTHILTMPPVCCLSPRGVRRFGVVWCGVVWCGVVPKAPMKALPRIDPFLRPAAHLMPVRPAVCPLVRSTRALMLDSLERPFYFLQL